MSTMEPLNETIELDLEESNDLTFKIRMEGTAMSPAKVRLVCEGSDFAYMFNGYGTGEDEVVQFTLPRMDKKLTEGTYGARVEVLVDNRYFAPLQFQINFKKTLSVVAESIQVVRKASSSDIKVTASPVSVVKPPAPVSIIKFEQRPTPGVYITEKQASPAPSPPVAQAQEAAAVRPHPKFSLKDSFTKKITTESKSDVPVLAPTLRDKFKK